MKERHLEILKLVNEKERISVKDLSQVLNISMVTIRKDLEELEARGLLQRQHGYAAKGDSDDIDSRMMVQYLEKKKIAQKAVSFVKPMETIMIESGSTCALFAQELAAVSDVTIITNSAYIARHVRTIPTAKVILLGGDYDVVSEVTTGPVTELCAREYFVDKLFVGIDGYTKEDGFTNVNHTRCSTVRGIAKQADKVIVLTTSEKFGKRSVAKVFSPEEVHMVVTDSRISEEYRDILASQDIRVEVADIE
ncbi:MAG: DeoR/GlpR transcriptional regulator [Lachnospiraceae bacterium]|nr:DeoR/GlpR transcriptional regulator [Lachnospiraceae bacterium]